MAEKKSILEEALLDIKKIQNALNANTKEILRSVTIEEIDGVVKESFMKDEKVYEEEELDNELEPEMGPEDGSEETPIEGGLDDIEGSEEVTPNLEPEMGPEDGAEMGMDASALAGDEMDMTTASDDDVIAIYKKLSGEDEIEIVGDEIHLNISEPGEYVVKANDLDTGATEPEMGLDGMGDDVDYEIEMGDEEGGSEEAPTDLVSVDGENGEEEGEELELDNDGGEETEEELTEAIPVGSAQAHRLPGKTENGRPLGAGADNLKESVNAKLVLETKKKYNSLLTEAKKLKTENDEFRTALKEFRNKLVETVVFNSNLTYVTRLFMEHSTTKAEKQNIIKRFDDDVMNLKESKKLYKTIANELDGRKSITEAIETKIIKEVNTSSSKQLNESTAYVDPSTKRILDLIQRVERK